MNSNNCKTTNILRDRIGTKDNRYRHGSSDVVTKSENLSHFSIENIFSNQYFNSK